MEWLEVLNMPAWFPAQTLHKENWLLPAQPLSAPTQEGGKSPLVNQVQEYNNTLATIYAKYTVLIYHVNNSYVN